MRKSTITLSIFGALCLAFAGACSSQQASTRTETQASNPAPQTANTTRTAPPATTAPAPASASGDERIAVNAADLYKAYDNDEQAADARYKGRQLSVTGVVEEIKLEGEQGVVVDLQGGDFMDTVFCFFDDSQKPAVAKLKKGQKVTINGTGDGKFVNPVVRFCEVAG